MASVQRAPVFPTCAPSHHHHHHHHQVPCFAFFFTSLGSAPPGRVWTLFTCNRRLPPPDLPDYNSNQSRPSWRINAVYTQGISFPKFPPPPPPRPTRDYFNELLDGDPISALNDRIRREHSKRERSSSSSSSSAAMDSEEADKYIQLVKEQQQRGLQKLKGDRQGKLTAAGGGFGYKVDPYSLRPGDYVVHKKVGVGRFAGIKFDVPKDSTVPIEYVFIEYADGMAKLPVKQATRFLYRYNLPNETKRPRTLSKLSDTGAWERRRIKGKVAVQKMVVDLMELYLHRLKQRRPPYPKSPAMVQFSSQFPYEPTPDQKQAFIDVEKDLTERETPMDRLICGDVGFGKTEVALRAIFCVVSAGKQAMVLAPTIVLAKQHFSVVSERFSRYPDIKVGLLSRFQTKSEKEKYIQMIKSGQLDIVVGTHSLLGSRVVYNNLGLLVVDEEQRFGVKQKEKIASFKTSVDVLTLSATPIPRTLYLALTGFRDASLISTPPPERVPIRTHLSAFSKEKVISAIKYELDRGGQVFYVLPRIKGLEEVMGFLEQSCPDVEIAIAHGKQYSKQLEDTMEKFAGGEIKILICTNIVESGLDIQNANTIIIQDVQQFGLAQLYQVAALKEDGCPRVWVVTSDRCQQQAAHGAGAFVWSCKALVSEIKTSQKEVEMMLQEHRSTSVQGKLLKHNLDSEVVDALKDLRNKLSENESHS